MCYSQSHHYVLSPLPYLCATLLPFIEYLGLYLHSCVHLSNNSFVCLTYFWRACCMSGIFMNTLLCRWTYFPECLVVSLNIFSWMAYIRQGIFINTYCCSVLVGVVTTTVSSNEQFINLCFWFEPVVSVFVTMLSLIYVPNPPTMG